MAGGIQAKACRAALAKAHLDQAALASEGLSESSRLTLLEPAIIQTILAGQQPRCMGLLWFQRNPLPTDWMARREGVAAFDA